MDAAGGRLRCLAGPVGVVEGFELTQDACGSIPTSLTIANTVDGAALRPTRSTAGIRTRFIRCSRW
jgi:hypothetical protein